MLEYAMVFYSVNRVYVITADVCYPRSRPCVLRDCVTRAESTSPPTSCAMTSEIPDCARVSMTSRSAMCVHV